MKKPGGNNQRPGRHQPQGKPQPLSEYDARKQQIILAIQGLTLSLLSPESSAEEIGLGMEQILHDMNDGAIRISFGEIAQAAKRAMKQARVTCDESARTKALQALLFCDGDDVANIFAAHGTHLPLLAKKPGALGTIVQFHGGSGIHLHVTDLELERGDSIPGRRRAI